MKTVPAFRVAADAPADVLAKLFAIISEMNSKNKTGFKRIGESQYRDSRKQWRMRSYIVSYDERTALEFESKCRAQGINAAIDMFYPSQPTYRHYLDVQESGLIKLHWHPKDTFIEVDPEKVNRHPLIGPGHLAATIVPRRVFFVGPNRQTLKVYRRYLNTAHQLSPFNHGITSDRLQYILEPIVTPGENHGAAMYILTECGMVARLTPSRFEWVINRSHVSQDEQERRIQYRYHEMAIDVGKPYPNIRLYRAMSSRGNPAFNESFAIASFSKEAIRKL